jgi:hypothetical protein
MGEIYLYIDDRHLDEAEAWIMKAIESDQRNPDALGLGQGLRPQR